MTVTANEITEQTFDVCVAGAGPAGVILALELSKRRPDWRIILVEYGRRNEERNDLDESIVIETPLNHHPPDECTNKGFGGTSRTWGGRCLSYDEIDFLERPVIGDTCTWNLALFHEVRRYYGVAAEYLDCGHPTFDLHEMPDVTKARISENFVEGDFTDSVVERWSLPTRFNTRYVEAVAAKPNLFLLEGARVAEIRASNGKVDSLDVLDRGSGTKLELKARQYVIAAGAQESTRLLLKSGRLFESVGGLPPSLGRYYQGHISGKVASIKFTGNPKLTDYGFLDDHGVYIRRRLQIPSEVLQRENLLNICLFLDNPLYFDPKHRSGTLSLIYLMMLAPVIGKRLAPPAIAQSVTKGRTFGIGGHLRNILMGLPVSILEPFGIFVKRYFPERKLPGVFIFNRNNEYALHFHAEQIPSANNRMELGNDGETLHIYYGYEDVDVESVIRSHALLDQWLRKTNSGELVYWYPEAELFERIRSQSRDGIHQVGTTRIATDPDRGVLNPDMRVWATENLYVCSSSAFPTSGQANPTFFLAAFAVRLAEHLAAK